MSRRKRRRRIQIWKSKSKVRRRKGEGGSDIDDDDEEQLFFSAACSETHSLNLSEMTATCSYPLFSSSLHHVIAGAKHNVDDNYGVSKISCRLEHIISDIAIKITFCSDIKSILLRK
jgi:hypothetical protein